MPTKTTPKDFFLHLAATVVLYVAAVALINLAFSIINYMVPDALASYYSSRSIAWPVSMLAVLIPVLYVIEWFIHRDYKLFPEKMTLWIRRWRIYLTLFLAGATIIGDLIALINTYLSGELTMRFVYKILAIFIVCGIVFTYYLLDRVDATESGKSKRYVMAVLGVVFALAAIVGGFLIVGSPTTQRALRFDQQRVGDLSNIQWQVISYWQAKGVIPGQISALRDNISGNIIPTDPETKAEYIYTKKGVTSFELCATFSLPSRDDSGKGGYYDGGISRPYPAIYPGESSQDNWKHDKGLVCFSRTIDPERYSVNIPVKR